jgi:hypothetical protein
MLAASILIAAVIAKAAFSEPTPNAWMWGGSWGSVVFGTLLGAYAGLVVGIFVARVYVAITIPLSKIDHD